VKCSVLCGEIDGRQALRSLDLRSNVINRLPYELGQLGGLRELHIQYNMDIVCPPIFMLGSTTGELVGGRSVCGSSSLPRSRVLTGSDACVWCVFSLSRA
jgi:hypothetical protein